MKRIFILFFVWLTGTLIYAQAPSISVSPLNFTSTMKADTTDTISVTISNSGNRDLNWQFTGKTINFSKADFANFSLAQNQDRITSNVWITRGNYQGLFNIATETDFQHSFSPQGTEWYYGPTHDADPMTDYDNWNDAIGGGSYTFYTDTFSLHLIEEDRFFDVIMKSWTEGKSQGGGGFSYTRIERFRWMAPEMLAGSVAPGEDTTINIVLNTAGMVEGVHNGFLYIKSDDPANPYIEIPVDLTVTGTPAITSNPASVDYGAFEVTGTKTMAVEISNTGTGTLSISNVQVNTAFFSVGETSFDIAPGKSHTLDVSFMPATLITYEDTVVISSNTADLKIALTGTGIKAPDISVDVSSFSEALNTDSTITRSIIISNNGDSTLNWKVKLRTTPVTFTKANFADWTLPQNYDMITPTVAIARKDFQGLFNILQESEYGSGPVGTQWAVGYSDDLTPGDYGNMSSLNSPPYLQDVPLSMYLADDDLYIDIMITDWTGNGQGGGYSYQRDGAVKLSRLPAT